MLRAERLIALSFDDQTLESQGEPFKFFGDEEIVATEPRAATMIGACPHHAPADHGGRIEPRGVEHVRDERCGRGLAMTARNRDSVLETHDLGEHFGALEHRDLRRLGLQQLRVLGRDR